MKQITNQLEWIFYSMLVFPFQARKEPHFCKEIQANKFFWGNNYYHSENPILLEPQQNSSVQSCFHTKECGCSK
jgi:hypothetical protein